MSLLHRRMAMKGNEMEKEWRVLKTISLDELPDSQNIITISADDDGNQFEVDEIYMRITDGTRKTASYNDVKINGFAIGEIRGGYPCEVFIKNIGGIWRVFYIAYSGNYSNGTLTSWGTFHYPIKTLSDVPKINQVMLGWVETLEAKVYAR